jgi:benzylsuccinate CoA-transferase BbsF subunit
MAMAPSMPLEGIRVADFGWRAVAPISARMLGWGGAEVIRVESATRHDGARLTPPLPPNGEGSFNVSHFFNNKNTNKLSVSLNLRDPRGRDLALKLASKCDIVVENFAGGVMERLGLGYEKLRELRPDIIMISHSLTGLSGPWKHIKGHGPMAAAMAGMNALSGYPDAAPIAPGQAYTDYIVNPHHSVFALLSALHYRRRTGKGQYIDLAQYESIIHTTGTAILEYTALGQIRNRMGNRSPYASPQGIYPCRPETFDGQTLERWCVISIGNEQEWKALCGVIGRDDLVDHPCFASIGLRKQREDEIDGMLSVWTADQRAEDVMHRLQAAGVPAGVVQNGRDLFEDPQMQSRNHYRKINHPEAGPTRYDGPPFTFSDVPLEVRPAPLLGEHNDYVFRDLLGLTDNEISEGYAEGFIA